MNQLIENINKKGIWSKENFHWLTQEESLRVLNEVDKKSN